MSPIDLLAVGFLGFVLVIIVLGLGLAIATRRHRAFQLKPTGLDRLECSRRFQATRFGHTHVRPLQGSDIAWCGDITGVLAGYRQTINCPKCVALCKAAREANPDFIP